MTYRHDRNYITTPLRGWSINVNSRPLVKYMTHS